MQADEEAGKEMLRSPDIGFAARGSRNRNIRSVPLASIRSAFGNPAAKVSRRDRVLPRGRLEDLTTTQAMAAYQALCKCISSVRRRTRQGLRPPVHRCEREL